MPSLLTIEVRQLNKAIITLASTSSGAHTLLFAASNGHYYALIVVVNRIQGTVIYIYKHSNYKPSYLLTILCKNTN